MKNLATKLFAVIFVLMLAAGCASSITAPQEIQKQDTKKEVVAPGDISGEGNMTSSVEKPEL